MNDEILSYDDLIKKTKKEEKPIFKYEDLVSGASKENEVTNEIEEEQKTFGYNFVDGTKGVASAPFQALGGTAEFTNWAINPWIGLGDATLKWVTGNGWQPELIDKEYFAEDGIQEAITPEAILPETMGGNFNKNVLAFFLNYGAAKKGFKSITMALVDPKQALQKAKALGSSVSGSVVEGLGLEVASGAFADVTAFNPEDGTAVDALVAHFPSLEDSVIGYLATDEDDSVAIIKLKQALEGAGITVGVSFLLKGLSAFKANHVDPSVNNFKLKEAQRTAIAKKAEELGIIADDIVEARRIMDDPKFVGPKPKQEPTDVIIDEDVLAKLIKKADDFDNIDLPINHKNFTSAKEVQVVIDKVIKSVKDNGYNAKWTSELSNEQTLKLANMLDLEGDVVAKGLSSIDDVAELPIRVVATKKVLQGLGKEAVRLSKLLYKNEDAVATAEFAKVLALIVKTTDELKTAIKAAARTTQAGKIKTGAAVIDVDAIANAARIFDGDIKQFAQKIALMDDFGEIVKAARRTKGQKTWDIATEIYINGLLSGPFTQVINTGSTFLETIVRPAELIVGGAATLNKEAIRQGFSRYRGMIKGIDDTIRAVVKAFKNEDLIGDKMGRIIENKAPKALSSKNLGLEGNAGGWIVDFIGGFFRLPSRLLITSDELFKQINYRAKLHELAVGKGLKKGLEGKQLDNFIIQFEKKGFDNNGKFINKEAKVYSRENTFTANLSEDDAWVDLGSGIQAWAAKDFNVFKSVIPFIRTPINLWRHTVRRMPVVGALQKQNFKMFQAGGVQRSEMIGRQIFGGLLTMKMIDLCSNDRVTGRGPKQPQLREAWLLTHAPYSFKVDLDNGDTKWVSYQRMDPRFSMLGIIADLYYFQSAVNVERDRNIMAGALASFAQNLTSKSYLTGITDLVGAIDSASPTRTADFLRNMALSFVPYSSFMRQTNDDKAMREVRTLADALNNIVWGDDEKLQPRTNMFGETQYKQTGYIGFPEQWWAPLIIGKTTTRKNSPIYKELAKLAVTTAYDKGEGVTKQPRNIYGTQIDLLNKKYVLDGRTALDTMHNLLKTHKLDISGAYAEFNGMTVKDALSRVIESTSYNKETLDEGTGRLNAAQARMIRGVYNAYKKQIREFVINNNPVLRKDFIEQKGNFRNSLTTKPENVDQAADNLQKLLTY